MIVLLMAILLVGGAHLVLISALEDLQGRHLVSLAREGAKEIRAVLRDRERQIKGFDMETFYQRYGDLPQEKHFLAYFEGLAQEFPVVSLLDKNGNEIARLINGKPQAEYLNFQYDPVVQSARRHPNQLSIGSGRQDPLLGKASVSLAYTFTSHSGRQFFGTLLLTLPLDRFEQSLQKISRNEVASLSLLSDQEELLTYHRTELVFQKLTYRPEEEPVRHQLFDEDLVLVAQKVEVGGWQVMASVPWQRYRAEVNKIRAMAIGFSFLVILLATVLTWKLTRLLTRNLDRLVDFADRVGHGDYHQQLPLDSSEEFNRLNNALNRMVIELEEHRRSIEDLQKIIQTIIDPLIVTDSQGLVVQVNQATLQLFGCDSARIIHRPLADLFLDTPGVLRRTTFSTGLICCPVSNLETKIRGAKGENISVLFSSAPCGNERDELGVVCILKDVTELMAARDSREKALLMAEEARRRVDVLLRSVPDGLVVVDLQGNIQLINNPAEKLLGAEAKIRVREIALRLLEEKGGSGRTLDVPLLSAETGVLSVIQAHASAVFDGHEHVIGLVMLLRDVSRERSMDQMKNEFISTAAHELRTPLASILGYSELMLEPTNEDRFSPEEKRDFLQEILERAETLARIIDDLLSISRIESGQPLVLELSTADISRVLERVVKQFILTSQSYWFELELPDRSVYMALDTGRMQQALENLLSNAVKYSSGEKPIRISGRRHGQSYLIQIEDFGIGMLPEQIAQIFDKFYRVDYSNTKTSGLGIGMSIVKQIVEGHGGTITIRSTLGEGTLVELSFPLPD